MTYARHPEYAPGSEAWPERPLGAALLDAVPDPVQFDPVGFADTEDPLAEFWEDEAEAEDEDLEAAERRFALNP